MTPEEAHEYLCGILAKLVPCSEITGEELADLASALGIKRSEFYAEPQPLNVIDWERKAA